MHRIAALSLLLALAALALPALADDKIRLEVPIPFVDDHEIDDEIVSHCGIQEHFTSRLANELRRVAVAEPAPITDMAGRVLKVQIVDAVWAGNWFLGHDQTVRVRGTLYQDGEHLAAFEGVLSGRDTTQMYSGCYTMKSNFLAMSWYIKRWLRNPVDGARIGRG